MSVFIILLFLQFYILSIKTLAIYPLYTTITCNPVAPVYISRKDLCPPDDWVTNWGKPTRKSVAATQSIITEKDGKVITCFRRVNTTQRGEPLVTTVPTIVFFNQIHPAKTLAPSHFVID